MQLVTIHQTPNPSNILNLYAQNADQNDPSKTDCVRQGSVKYSASYAETAATDFHIQIPHETVNGI